MKHILLAMLTFAVAFSQAARAEEYRAKLTAEETKSIWLKSCESSLSEAMIRYGSKITFPSKRDRQSFLEETCNKAVDAQLKDFARLKKTPPEVHACMYVADRDDIVVGFGKVSHDATIFAFGYCNKL